ncbi:MAG: hypothetical protein ACKVU0_09955 [Saprospiraceae bacterium]
MAIPFSPQNPGTWLELTFPIFNKYQWILSRANDAKKAVIAGQKPFHPIAFKNADLQEIVNHPLCEYVAFSHLLIQDQNNGQHSTLIAYGLAPSDRIIVGNGSKICIGTPSPTEIHFDHDLFKEAEIVYKNTTPGFTWTYPEADTTLITDWLAEPMNQGRFQKGVDFLVRVRIKKNEAKAFLEKYDLNSLIVFYPGVFKCEIDHTRTTTPDETGDYCNLIVYGQHPIVSISGNKKHKFFLCSDAWRPNWRNESMLNKFFGDLFLSIEHSINKISSLLLRPLK